jgi:hypothetical protein
VSQPARRPRGRSARGRRPSASPARPVNTLRRPAHPRSPPPSARSPPRTTHEAPPARGPRRPAAAALRRPRVGRARHAAAPLGRSVPDFGTGSVARFRRRRFPHNVTSSRGWWGSGAASASCMMSSAFPACVGRRAPRSAGPSRHRVIGSAEGATTVSTPHNRMLQHVRQR